MGQAFQYTPGGVRPFVLDSGAAVSMLDASADELPAPAYDPEAESTEVPIARPVQPPRVAVQPKALAQVAVHAAAAAITPRDVVKAARARLKEIRAELKRHEALKKERAQLERMLAAAGKPPASLTQINSRRAG